MPRAARLVSTSEVSERAPPSHTRPPPFARPPWFAGPDAPDSAPCTPRQTQVRAALPCGAWPLPGGAGRAAVGRMHGRGRGRHLGSAGSSSLAVLAQREAPLRVLRLLAAGANHARPRADGRTWPRRRRAPSASSWPKLPAPPRGAPAALPAAAPLRRGGGAVARAPSVRRSAPRTRASARRPGARASPTIGAPAPTTQPSGRKPPPRTPHTATPSHARAVASSPASRLSSSGRRRSVSFTPGDVSVVVESPGRPGRRKPTVTHTRGRRRRPPPPPQPQPLAAARPPTMMARDRWGPSSSRADADADGCLAVTASHELTMIPLRSILPHCCPRRPRHRGGAVARSSRRRQRRRCQLSHQRQRPQSRLHPPRHPARAARGERHTTGRYRCS